MEKVEAVRLALAELGDRPTEQVAAFVQQRHGLKVAPGIVAVVRAMLREKQLLASFRQPPAEDGVANQPLAGHPVP
jgi:hypothetical protein